MSEELTPMDRMELWMSALNEAITNGTENSFMPYNRYELWMKKLCEAILAKDPADPDVVQQFVEDWLDDHPEATTTVEDGAVTKAKLDSAIQLLLDALSVVADEQIILKNTSYTAINYTNGQKVKFETQTGVAFPANNTIYQYDSNKTYLGNVSIAKDAYNKTVSLKNGTAYLKCSNTPGVPYIVSIIDESKMVHVQEQHTELLKNISYFEAKTNVEHNLVNYGYGDTMESLARNPNVDTEGTAVGVDRIGTLVKLNYGYEGATWDKRVRVSGTIERRAGTTTYKSWVGNLQLKQGHLYSFRVKKLSGTCTLNNAPSMPKPVVYESQGGSSIATIFKEDDTTCEVIFTAPAGMLTLAVFIKAASVLTDCVCNIVLEDLSAKISDQYVSELTDTVAKVRNEMTEPCIVFLWATDNHRFSDNAAGVQNFNSMIENMKAFAQKVPCDFLLNTGDLTDGDTQQEVTLLRAYESMEAFRSIGVPYVFAQGNHDTNYATSSHQYLFTMEECYKAYFAGANKYHYNASENGTEYFIDFDELNVRFIVLNANNCTNDLEYAYGQSTATWLTNAMNTDKTVILAVHLSPISSQVYGNVPTTRSSGIVNALQTFVDNGGNLIMISGHSHNDVAFVTPWLSVMQDCQRFCDVSEDVTDEDHDMTGFIDVVRKNARIQYESSEDLWSVCVYKPQSNDISFIRFGAGKDRYYHVSPIAPTTLTTKMSNPTWTSSDTTIATVSDGVVTGVSTGRCGVIAKDADGNYECWIVAVE